jgi:hypothetical protein
VKACEISECGKAIDLDLSPTLCFEHATALSIVLEITMKTGRFPTTDSVAQELERRCNEKLISEQVTH